MSIRNLNFKSFAFIFAVILVLLPGVGSARDVTVHSVGMGEASIVRGLYHSEWLWYVQDGSSATVDIPDGDAMWIQDIMSYDGYMLSRVCPDVMCEYPLTLDGDRVMVSVDENSPTEYWIYFVISQDDQAIVDAILHNTDASIIANLTSVSFDTTHLVCDTLTSVGCTRFVIQYDHVIKEANIILLPSSDLIYVINPLTNFRFTVIHELGHIDGVGRYDNISEAYADEYAESRAGEWS